jgi:large subunit ribosomal protein L19e
MELTTQRRLAAKLLKCGKSRVWIDPDRIGEVEEAITKADLRNLIKSGVIKKLPKRGISRARKKLLLAKKRRGKRKGIGSRKGTARARQPKKELWVQKIRPQRKLLKLLRAEGKIDKRTYRKFYLLAKGGMFRSKAHLELQLKPYLKSKS